METLQINGHFVEYIDEIHQYIVDGIIVPSVSQILATKFNDYVGVSKEIMEKAAEKGTAMHKAIELFEKQGQEDEIKELHNYKFLKKHYNWANIENELPVIYEENGQVLFAGRLDQVIEIDGKLGINDFKRVSAPNKEKICYQLNLYKLGYEQSYHKTIEFLSFTHLREDVRKFVKLPVKEEEAKKLLKEFFYGK